MSNPANPTGTAATTTTTTAASSSSSSTYSLPLQILSQHTNALIEVDTVEGFVYQGTLQSVDEHYNLCMKDVTVRRYRTPNDLLGIVRQPATTSSSSSLISFRALVFLRSSSLVSISMPEELKKEYVKLAAKVKRELSALRNANRDARRKRIAEKQQQQQQAGGEADKKGGLAQRTTDRKGTAGKKGGPSQSKKSGKNIRQKLMGKKKQ